MSFSGIFFIFGTMLIGGVVLGLFLLLAVLGVQFATSVLGRIVSFIGGIALDVVRFLGSVVGLFVSVPIAVCFLVLGRWAFANRMARWFGDSAAGLIRHPLNAVLVRPLRLVFLDSLADTVFESLPGSHKLVVPGAAGSVAAKSPARIASSSVTGDGTVRFDRYEIVGELKSGGSGARLYVARPDRKTRMKLPGRPTEVVIKSFVLEHGSTLPAIVRESRALESARSMGLVFEHHLDDGHFWYVMPYHAGESLAAAGSAMHRASKTSELRGESLREAVGYVRDLVATLVRFHESGLWHKDVKPDNLIVHDGRAHLVDLGLVTSLQSPMTLTTHGTEYFRDPEMVRMALRGVKVDEVDGSKFDIYGAGAVLYFMLENDFPAHGGLSDFSHEVPDALRWIVRRAMADYAKRYESSGDMLVDLDTVLASEDLWAVRPADLPSMQDESSTVVVPPPPPFVRMHRMPPASPPRRTPVVSAPQPRRRPVVAQRPPVPTDRPTGLLIALGLLAITAIIGIVYSVIPSGGQSPVVEFSERASRVLGPGVTTVTLLDPVAAERVLLVMNEQQHLDSGELARALDGVIDCYVSSDFILDRSPDLDSLGRLIPEENPEALCRTILNHTSKHLQELGYSGVARVMIDDDGTPSLHYHNSSNGLYTISLDRPEDCFTIPGSLEIDSARERGMIGVERESRPTIDPSALHASAAAILGRQHHSGVDPCPRIPGPNFDHSWPPGPLPFPALSTPSSLVPSPMPASARPTSPVARPPMSRAIRMSA